MKLTENELYEIHRVEPKGWEKIKEQIMKIENSAFEKDVRQNEDDLRETFENDKSICLVVVDKNNNKIFAYTIGASLDWYTFLDFDPHYRKNDSFYIESTAVLPEYQGRGIGKMLKKILIEEVRKMGYKRIVCHATNEKIKHINEDFGFRVIGHIKKWVGKRDAWYMEKIIVKIGPGGI